MIVACVIGQSIELCVPSSAKLSRLQQTVNSAESIFLLCGI